MNRWITQAVAFGVAISETAGSPLNLIPGLQLSSGSHSEGGVEYNPADVYFEYLNQCSGANLDKESCLVSKTLDALMGMGEHSTSPVASPLTLGPTGPSSPVASPLTGLTESSPSTHHSASPSPSHSFGSTTPFPTPSYTGSPHGSTSHSASPSPSLGSGSDCGSAPDISEQELRGMMDGFKEQCIESGVPISHDDFEGVVEGILTTLGADSCHQELCQEEANELLVEIMFQEAAKCAQVELDIDQCLMNQVVDMLINGDSEIEMERARRNLQETSSCESMKQQVAWYVSFMMIEAEAKCSQLGESVSTEELDNATSDLTAIFMAQPCWGGSSCEEDHNEETPTSSDGMNYLNIAVRYIEECAGLDLNLDTDQCLVSSTFGALESWGAAPIGPSANSNNSSNHHSVQPSGRRFLEEEDCAPPQFPNDTAISLMVGASKQFCVSMGLDVSDQQVEETSMQFADLFGAEDCWVDLCEEGSNPSETMIRIIFEEIAHCAGAELDLPPCLLDQIFELIFSPDGDESLDGVRRKLEHALGGTNDDTGPCPDQPSDAELSFVVHLLLAGAQEQCTELGQPFDAGVYATAESDLMKIFSAQQCFGDSSDCTDQNGDNHSDEVHSSYLEFVGEGTTWLLGQCVNVEEVSCVFSRSIEVMHGMTILGWTHDGPTDPHHIALESASSMCTPPSVDYDIDQIAAHAKQHCEHAGELVSDDQHEQAVEDLKNLTALPDCWTELCYPETKGMIVQEWMDTCASIDLKFLTTPGPYMMSNVSLSSDRLLCMTEYISVNHGGPGRWECNLPHLGHDVCNVDIGKEAYVHCGGVIALPPSSDSPTSWPTSSSPSPSPSPSPSRSPPPSPFPSMHFSMSFAYDDDWVEPEMCFSYSLSMSMEYGNLHGDDNQFSMPDDDWYLDDFSMPNEEWHWPNDDVDLSMPHGYDDYFSMQHDDWLGNDDDHDDWYGGEHLHNDQEMLMFLYIEEVCNLMTELTTDDAKRCLQPVCDVEIEDAFRESNHGVDDDGPGHPNDDEEGNWDDDGEDAWDDDFPPISFLGNSPTMAPTVETDPTMSPTSVSLTTQAPTVTTASPTPRPTPFPTKQPTPSPTIILQFGSVTVSVDVEITLDGIEFSDIDISSLDTVVDLLESVMGDLLPEGATIRIISVGSYSAARRLLRFLQDDAAAGVPIKFEIIMKETCDSAECDASEVEAITATLSQEVMTDFKTKVESGELTTKIQQEAESSGVTSLNSVTINASKMQVSEPKTTVESGTPTNPDDDDLTPVDDDDSASGLSVVLTFFAVIASTIVLVNG